MPKVQCNEANITFVVIVVLALPIFGQYCLSFFEIVDAYSATVWIVFWVLLLVSVQTYSAKIRTNFCALLSVIVKTYSAEIRVIFWVLLLMIVITYSAKSLIIFWVLLHVIVKDSSAKIRIIFWILVMPDDCDDFFCQDLDRVLCLASCDCEDILAMAESFAKLWFMH